MECRTSLVRVIRIRALLSRLLPYGSSTSRPAGRAPTAFYQSITFATKGIRRPGGPGKSCTQ
jgi:hypothetical protein